MNKKLQQKIVTSLLGILIAAALFFSPVTKIPVLDTKTDTYFNDAITKGWTGICNMQSH